MKPSTKGTGEKFRVWTDGENKALREAFFKYRESFKAGRHGTTISRIKDDLKKRGIIRSEKAVNRRLSRMGLTFYKVRKDEILLKCENCKKQFFAYGKATKRTEHKQKLCKDCQKIKNREWDKLNHNKKIKYYREYYKKFKEKKK